MNRAPQFSSTPRGRRRGAAFRRAALAWLLVPGLMAGPARAALPVLDELLLGYVHQGYVDYDALAADGRLDEVIDRIAAATLPAEPAERRALLINAYNAAALDAALGGASLETRRGRRSYARTSVVIAGERLELGDLARERLDTAADPRIHFALVDPALASPRLASSTFKAELLDAQLEFAARLHVNDYTRNRFDVARRIAWLSPVFRAHRDEFRAAADGSLQGFVARYVGDAEVEALLRDEAFELRFMTPDWILNGRRAAR